MNDEERKKKNKDLQHKEDVPNTEHVRILNFSMEDDEEEGSKAVTSANSGNENSQVLKKARGHGSRNHRE